MLELSLAGPILIFLPWDAPGSELESCNSELKFHLELQTRIRLQTQTHTVYYIISNSYSVSLKWPTHSRQTYKTVRLPASEQSHISVPCNAMATEFVFFWPRSEGRTFGPVHLLTVGAKFTELANIVMPRSESLDSQHFTNLRGVTWTLCTGAYMFFATHVQITIFPQVVVLISCNNESFLPVCYVPAVCWWGSW